jgi:hypothetical protein
VSEVVLGRIEVSGKTDAGRPPKKERDIRRSDAESMHALEERGLMPLPDLPTRRRLGPATDFRPRTSFSNVKKMTTLCCCFNRKAMMWISILRKDLWISCS